MDIPLPPESTGTLNSLLHKRSSTKSFGDRPLGLEQLAALVWAAQGRTAAGRGVTPSAHALYPLTLTVLAGNVHDLPAGAYHYDERHALHRAMAGDHRNAVAATTLADRTWLRHAAAMLVFSADPRSVNGHFADQPPQGHRGERYAWLESGHCCQNVYLRAAELDVGAVVIGGFDDDRLAALDILPDGHRPLVMMGLGLRA
jgi:SagB-type dehydrogenase family enzyme